MYSKCRVISSLYIRRRYIRVSISLSIIFTRNTSRVDRDRPKKIRRVEAILSDRRCHDHRILRYTVFDADKVSSWNWWEQRRWDDAVANFPKHILHDPDENDEYVAPTFRYYRFFRNCRHEINNNITYAYRQRDKF